MIKTIEIIRSKTKIPFAGNEVLTYISGFWSTGSLFEASDQLKTDSQLQVMSLVDCSLVQYSHIPVVVYEYFTVVFQVVVSGFLADATTGKVKMVYVFVNQLHNNIRSLRHSIDLYDVTAVRHPILNFVVCIYDMYNVRGVESYCYRTNFICSYKRYSVTKC